MSCAATRDALWGGAQASLITPSLAPGNFAVMGNVIKSHRLLINMRDEPAVPYTRTLPRRGQSGWGRNL